MKLLSSIFIIASLIASAFCDGSTNYELTYYGQKGETHAKRDPSCPQYDDDNLPKYFAALGTKLHNYKSYCDKFAIFMSSNGFNTETVAKAVIVDSCSSCGAYHLDVSLDAFTKIGPKSKGEIPIIWGVYSRSGSEVAGPFYSSVSGTAKKLGLSSDAFVSAFRANAKSLASSGDSTREFSASGVHVEPITKKTTRTTTRTTTKRIATTRAAPKNTPVAPKPVVPKPVTTRAPFPLANQPKQAPGVIGGQGQTQTPGTKQVTNPTKQGINSANPANSGNVQGNPANSGSIQGNPANPANPAKQLTPATKQIPAASSAAAQPTQPANQPVEKVIEDNKEKEEEEEKGGLGAVGILAIGGGCLGAAGAGLLFMRKKSPTTYESMKQKFPEAFSNVKRGLTRSATSVKRTLTKRNANQNDTAYRV